MSPALSKRAEPQRNRRPFSFDRPLHALIGQATAGISPAALTQAYTDWAQHLLFSPDKQGELVEKAARKWVRFLDYCLHACTDPACDACIEPLTHDQRFVGPAWRKQPFAAIYQGFLLSQQWWHNATTGIAGVSKHHEDVVSFVARQLLDITSPANWTATNPEILEATMRQGGLNFVRGAANFLEDWRRGLHGEPPAGTGAYQVARDVAITPGKIVFRNQLIELIQYAPTTKDVYAEPILIVPAWIMKYYILDLSPENSLVKHLVELGHTVFIVSWRNPTGDDRDLGLDDYRRLGAMAALDAIASILPPRQIHAVGYCLGGTLMTIAAAAMARGGDDRLKSLTLLAAQTDFTEAGELMLFIDEAQVSFLENMMAEQGYLDTRQMTGAFQLLRSNDLIWSAMVQTYLLGERRPMIDLMAWNADTTRMPFRMHSEYLRRLFLANDLAESRFEVEGKPVSLRDIRALIFAVSTIADHVAPWRSVYKIQALTDADVTFVLSNGGHNAGIVSPPGHPHRHHQIATHKESENYVDPDSWQALAEHHEGSWWPCWEGWLVRHSSDRVPPPAIGGAAKGNPVLEDAPGTYVLER
ncbi:PHA/PHB synthase family protein [Desertibaculum subflavum]|uniref:PHA/PHB synthase family protein n=1 Tax=Desertibaculum subflavum TaxID=2268458 RepID=UPI0034D2FDA2